ncbi:uncharacterized protein LOC130745329 [Lotus japonicus]|uniref:uncharacterized protein LOC130745329 n=1 Tax=Lotus japonicus TaxID=34305 RepID=UPI00258DA8E8|nr:uncharacterized protein LOC130745329 [Lotus japonicus]
MTANPPLAINYDVLSNSSSTSPKIPIEANWILYPCFFTCKVSQNQVSGSQLNVPVHVYEYLRDTQAYKWTLRGPTGMQVECSILGVPQRKYAKFGRGWKSFCTSHDLKAGDVLSFFLTSEVLAFVDVLIHDKK